MKQKIKEKQGEHVDYKLNKLPTPTICGNSETTKKQIIAFSIIFSF